MNIDMTIDFDALLEEAKAKRKEYDEVIDKYRHTYIMEPGLMDYYPDEVKPILIEARDKYLDWIDKNITKRGLSLELDMLSRPIAITAVLAGKKI